jgi:hypothetical protein
LGWQGLLVHFNLQWIQPWSLIWGYLFWSSLMISWCTVEHMKIMSSISHWCLNS